MLEDRPDGTTVGGAPERAVRGAYAPPPSTPATSFASPRRSRIQRRLAAPQASVEKSSPVCGSRVVVDLVADAEGRVAELGQEVRACALGQASAALMGAHALGRTRGRAGRGARRARRLPRRHARRSGRLAGPRRLRRGAPLSRAPRRHPACRSRPRPRPRARRVPAPMHAALAAPRRGDPARLRARLRARCSAGSGSARPSAIWSPARWSGRSCSAWSAAPRASCTSPRSASPCCCSWSGSSSIRRGCGGCGTTFSGFGLPPGRAVRHRHRGPGLARHPLDARGGARARPAAGACPRPRRCCRCCSRPGGSAPRSASAPSRSCCSRTSRSCR